MKRAALLLTLAVLLTTIAPVALATDAHPTLPAVMCYARTIDGAVTCETRRLFVCPGEFILYLPTDVSVSTITGPAGMVRITSADPKIAMNRQFSLTIEHSDSPPEPAIATLPDGKGGSFVITKEWVASTADFSARADAERIQLAGGLRRAVKDTSLYLTDAGGLTPPLRLRDRYNLFDNQP